MKGITGKVAIVTGGASGIGRASALRFAKEGATVVIGDIDRNGGKETVEMIQNSGGEAIFIQTDVSDPRAVERMVEVTIDTYDRLDIAHNNAGFTVERKGVADADQNHWSQILDVYLTGVWFCLKYQLPALTAGEGGSIVNTSAVDGLRGATGLAHYSAAKHGVIGLTRSAALEYGTEDVRINAVCPGPIETPSLQKYVEADSDTRKHLIESVPLDRLGCPDEVAATVVWLSSADASFITGQSIAVDGGQTA